MLPHPSAQQARALFFDQGQEPVGMVDSAILESWRRCAQSNRSTGARIVFNVHDRDMVRQLQDQHTALIQDFESTLGMFAQVLHSSGFHPVLTDLNSVTIARFSDARETKGDLYHALQLGSDMSELAIGTAAMNCALACQRPVQVFGEEHYCDANASFSCAAAPVFGIDGRLAGAVNLTKHTFGREFGALSLVESCATAMEHRQLERLLARLTLRMSWTANGESRNATVAFGQDGEVLGMTREASRILNPLGHPLQWLSFDRVFEGEFGPWFDQLGHTARPQPIRLHSGLIVFIESRNHVRHSPAPPKAQTDAPQMGEPSFTGEFHLAVKAQGKGLSVLIRGETGTGKEVVARNLHQRQCPTQPFVAINCAALPEALIESELFGYSDGAFTGGRKGGASGRVEEADGGVLFLDEIGDMPLALQSRLLRVLDSQEVTRLGSSKARKVNFKLICATHQDLQQLIAAGRFRADLFYRIAGMVLTLKPLRERTQLASLFEHLAVQGCQHSAGITPPAMTLLLAYPWPGNAREALSVLKRATLLCEPHEPISAHGVQFALPGAANNPLQKLAFQPPTPLAKLEEHSIEQALSSTHGNVSMAADQLGISRSTLQRRIRNSERLLRIRDTQRL